jgi:uncharacterized protein YndB with AHSA1/START domain
MTDLAFSLERTITIRAQRSTVFRFFTDSERFARWWGKGSEIDPREGGRLRIQYPDGSTASGTVLEIRAPDRIVFTYGYDSPDKPIAPGGSRVVIMLHEEQDGTRLDFRHDVASEAIRDMHVMGWRYQLAVFAHVSAQDQHRDVQAKIDAWFALWAEKDAAARAAALAQIASPRVSFRDQWGCISGREELAHHVGAVQIHMPAKLERRGNVRHAQGIALADWVAVLEEEEVMRGTNVYELAPDGLIAAVTGISS